MERKDTLPLLGYRRRPNQGLCPASSAVKAVCRERASKRWSALLTQTKSRIGYKCGMRKRLGEKHWAAFVRHAEAEYKKVLGTDNPADLMTKYLSRDKIDGCLKQLGQEMKEGRAEMGLELQGQGSQTASP